jgi:hypothetical protein
MPAASYGIARLPPWIAIQVVNTTVFGFGDSFAVDTIFSEELMAREIEAVAGTFANAHGLKIMVGHHPIFTPGKRTFHHNGDGEILYMRYLRQVIEDYGVHFYFSGHEHHQSHMTGPTCEHITQGCGGARQRPNPKHSRREQGWRDIEKVLRYLEIVAGFAVVDAYAAGSVRLRFFGIPFGEAAHEVRVIYECRWQGVGEIGDRNLRRATGRSGSM